MTFSEQANRSVNDLRVLVQIDVGDVNTQWINAGAGLWYVNFDGLYPEVDPSLLDGFTPQVFGDVASLSVDTIQYTSVASLALVTSISASFYFNGVNKIYINLNDDPILHDILFGVVLGFSYNEFIPLNSNTVYTGRLSNEINISQSRDPLYFGKIQFSEFDISVINSDGKYDTMGELAFYGNPCRILVGYKDLPISEYITLSQATIEGLKISEYSFDITTSDPRKALTKEISYTCTNKNALLAIEEIMTSAYSTPYNSTYYNTSEWNIAKALVDNVTIILDSTKLPDIITLIEKICVSVFGVFIIQPDGKYSFKLIDTSTAALTTIPTYDILNPIEINYNPTEVISSIRVGFDISLNMTTDQYISWLKDTSYEASVFLKYKIYNQRDFETVLHDQAGAQALLDIIMTYFKDIHGQFPITVPMKYYTYNIGDILNVEINRETTTFLGTKKCEILSKSYSLSNGFITFGMRIV